MTSFAIQNFGCRVNQAESFAWAERLERHGLQVEEDPLRADIFITLTSKAERDGHKFIRRLGRQNPEAKLILTGCSVEADRAAFERNPQAWFVLTNKEKETLADKIMAKVEEQPAQPYRPLRSRALLKIQDGCNLRCTYCVIPRMRGRSRSVSREEVLLQSKRLIEQGFREIVLCGIHLSSYGRDLEPSTTLRSLLEELTALDGLGKIRLSSLDPAHLDEELLMFITGNEKICPHFHLSLQHASDKILERMGRKSRAADYERILSTVRQRSPEAALGADVMVGFPGESEEDFEACYRFIAGSPLTYLHVFSYSPRPSTVAASWPQIDGRTKKIRAWRLRQLSLVKRLNFQARFLGRVAEGIVTRKEGEEAEILTGNYLNVRVHGCAQEAGQAVRVRIESVDSAGVRGKLIV